MFSPLQEDDDDATHNPSQTLSSSPCCHHSQCLHAFNLPKETFALINATFVAVATILGTGILALPVKLSRSGLVPFSLTFTLCLFMQLATVILMVELLQRTHAEIGVRLYREQQQQGTSSTTTSTTSQSSFSSSSSSLTLDLDSNSVELISTTTSSSDEQEKGSSKNMDSATRAALTVVGGGGGDAAAAAAPSFLSSSSSSSRENSIFSVTSKNGSKDENSLSLDSKRLPDLHRMGKFFLKKKWMASMFDASVVLHFCAAMISCVFFFFFSLLSFFFSVRFLLWLTRSLFFLSLFLLFQCVIIHTHINRYNLAGPEAYGDLFDINYNYLIIPFWLIYVTFLILGRSIVQPTISFLTFFK